MRSVFGATLAALLLSGGTAATFGCSDCSVTGQAVIPFTGGHTNASRTIYESGAVDAEMLHFPQGRTYNLEHGLGTRPVSVDLYVSFREKLTSEGGKEDKTRPNNLSPSAGNQAVIEAWDDEIVRVRNDTCAEFYLRVVAFADPDAAVSTVSGVAGAAGAPAQ